MASASSPIDLAPPQQVFSYYYHIFLRGIEIEFADRRDGSGKKDAVPHLVGYSKHNLFILLREQIQYEGKSETPGITAESYIFDNVMVPRDAVAGIKIFGTIQRRGMESWPTETAGHQP